VSRRANVAFLSYGLLWFFATFFMSSTVKRWFGQWRMSTVSLVLTLWFLRPANMDSMCTQQYPIGSISVGQPPCSGPGWFSSGMMHHSGDLKLFDDEMRKQCVGMSGMDSQQEGLVVLPHWLCHVAVFGQDVPEGLSPYGSYA